MSEGRLTDVLIEYGDYTDPRTGMLVTSNLLTVWADDGMKEFIMVVEGICDVIPDSTHKSSYLVVMDKRYDREWIKAEIEAAIKINQKS